MPDQMPRKSKTPAQEAFETLAFLWGGLAVAAFFGWQYNMPIVHPLVQQVNQALSPYTLRLARENLWPRKPGPRPFVQPGGDRHYPFRSLDDADSNPPEAFIRDLIRRGERAGRKIEAVHGEVQIQT